MISLYRIALRSYADLSGIGGLTYSGRWNLAGYRVVYASENASLAAWEKIVNVASIHSLPADLVLMEISVPADDILEVPASVLIDGWDSFPYLKQTMDFGTNFLKDNEHLILKVPSAVIRTEFNFLINPSHPDFSKCQIVDTTPFVFDDRILK